MQDRLERIEQELERVLPAAVTPSWIDWVTGTKVENPTTGTYDRFCLPARDLLGAGGKRWRPLLMVLIAEMLGGEEAAQQAYRLTPVVELPHNGSLIIDDIEDSSEVRRGAPAAYITHGVDVSINAGNLLYYLPTAAIDDSGLPADKQLKVYQVYAKYLRRVHLGQGLDITWHRDAGLIPDPEEYEQMCRFKTGCLAGMSAEIGAVVATDDGAVIRRAGVLAEKIGVGFQIKDDVINIREGNPGKHRGDDIVENKKSLPVILFLQQHPDRLPEVLEVFSIAKTRGIDRAHDEVERLIGLLMESGVVEQAEARAMELLEESVTEIRELFDDSLARDELLAMIDRFRRS